MLLRRLTLAGATIAVMTTQAQAAGTAQGDWLTQSGTAKVHIAPCGDRLCGVIVWLKRPLDPDTGKPQKDEANPDPKLRDRPVLGLRLLHDLKPASEGHWAGGKIYDPQSGKTYDSKVSVNPDGTLKVEGCIAILCQAQTWKPAA